MPTPDETKNRIISATITAVIMAIAVVICLAFGYMPPDPPIPEEGVEVNLGNSDMGLGDSEQIDGGSAASNPAPASSADEDISSQSTEESVSLPNKANSKPSKTQQEQPKETPKSETKPAEPSRDYNDIWNKTKEKGKSKGGSEGNTSGSGNMGNPHGNPNASGYNGGNGGGKSGNYSLKGRSAITIPKPEYSSEKEGQITIDIYVDRNGNVVSAKPARERGNLTDPKLIEKCIAKAKEAKFSPSETADEKQYGTITYVFRRD